MSGAGIHRLFEAQVERTPDLVAVVAGRAVSYRDLNARSNDVALRLLARGVKPNGLVGLLADRSIEMVVGLLGILKAGGVHVPLNPSYPVERLISMTKDVELALVLTAPNQAALGGALGAETIAFPAGDADASNPDVDISPEQLAYAIFTSGSTGTPKAVALPHAGLSALLTFTREQMQIGPGDVVLQFASVSFDASLWEILAALISGATLAIGTSDELMPGPALHGFLQKHAVTIALLSPSVLHMLPAEGLDALRIVVAGTEKLTGGIVSRWKSPARRFFNAYGPTEATIYQTIWEAPDGPPPDLPPIGTPTPGVDVYILDESLQPVTDGASGELCLAGPCLGRGYINRPDLTREKFVDLPLGSSGEPVRVYRSGDVAKRLPDGNIAYLGRSDLQVKVRGFRVEPGEVETVLEGHPGVDSSAVVANTDGAGHTRLWAYFIPRGDALPASADLKAFLAACLPDYMIPSGFSVMKQWPLSANGKLDRRQLPAPTKALVSVDSDARQLSATEAQLLSWCRDILGHEGLGPDDGLLDEGFHSLSIAQLLWRIQDTFGISPAFSEMFACRAVADVASWIDQRSAERGLLDPVTPADRSQHLPLSSAQERVWFLERLYSDNNAYRFQAVLRFHGRLNISALEHALNGLVQRHEILRTTFPHEGGRPFQRIHPFTPFRLSVDALSSSMADAEIERAIREPFDLERLPLVRWRLFQVSAEEHWLLHTEHHVLHDGWAYGVFLRELFASYDALARGRTPDLPPLPLQFADLARWQQQQLAAGRLDRQLDYWVKKLRAAPAPPELPTDSWRPAARTFEGAQIRHAFDRALYANLLAACARERVTPYMWLHTAFQAFLFRYTGQTDIVVGSGFANRRASDARLQLGMMINTVALRMDFGGEPTFREALVQFRRTSIEAADNQDAPYDKVIQRLGSGTELFNCFFDSFDQPFPAYRSEGLRVDSVDGICNGRCKFDLTALVVPGEDAPTLLWEYKTDLFTEATATRMMRHFMALVAASAARPEAPVSQLPILSEEERQHLVDLGRGRSAPQGRDRVEQVFARIAAAHPNAPAVVCGQASMSYGALDFAAEQLVSRLRRLGVVRGGVVALSLPRGAEAICAMLAILKCGCAYLPLDPSLPAARREALLRAVSPQALLTADAVTLLDGRSGADPSGEPAASDAAYVMFTSGTTGVPKAVYAPHRGVTRLVCGVDYVRLDAGTRFLQAAPLAFDASTLEIWGPLLNGGVVVVHPDDVPDLADLGRTIAEHRVNTAWLTAALFNRIIDSVPESLRPLRQILTGGEALSVGHVARALAALPDATIINGYGPTETTTFATTFTVPPAFEASARRVPIGRPIPETSVYVLDAHRELQPMGVVGEIYVGGEGLGRLTDEALEASTFVRDPFAAGIGARLYRTGDRGRLLTDGTFDFVARLDRQVKVRGYRIEPGEIESVLARCPSVREAAVLPSEDSTGDRRLVAYVAIRSNESGSMQAADLQNFVAQYLPSYLVPSSFVFVPALPLTVNGKLDTVALSQLDSAEPADHRHPHVAPRTSIEEVVAGVWANVLGIDSPGVDDNFFDVGGHSLLALKLVHALNTAMGLTIPVRQLFTQPTIQDLARVVEADLASQFGSTRSYKALVPLKPGGDGPPFFLVAGGGGGEAELIAYAKLARYLDPQQRFFGLRARGVDELIEPHATVEAMAADYIQEIRKVQAVGPYTIGGACVGGVVALEMAQQLRRASEEVRALLLIDSYLPHWFWLLRNRTVTVNRLQRTIEHARANGVVAAAQWMRGLLAAPITEHRNRRRRVRDMRRHLDRLATYKPKPYTGKVIFIRAENGADENLVARWRQVAVGPFEVHEVPGDHVSHLRDHAEATARCLDACLQDSGTGRIDAAVNPVNPVNPANQ